MRGEYEAIAAAGVTVQIDCPDLAMGRHIQYADLSVEEFRKRARLHIEALNHALVAIPPERVRMHLCLGNYEGPHHHDVPLAEIIDVVFAARPATISFEAANPRHAHEWTLFERVKLPEGKTIFPGVIESKSNFIEHPELIAQRIARYANLVGRDNVIAGSDCGFGTWVGQAAVDPDVCGPNSRRWPKARGWRQNNSGAIERAQSKTSPKASTTRGSPSGQSLAPCLGHLMSRLRPELLDAAAPARCALRKCRSIRGRLVKCRGLRTTLKVIRIKRQRGR